MAEAQTAAGGDARAREMQACLKCGRRFYGDYLAWKGGINRALCENCRWEVEEKETWQAKPVP